MITSSSPTSQQIRKVGVIIIILQQIIPEPEEAILDLGTRSIRLLHRRQTVTMYHVPVWSHRILSQGESEFRIRIENTTEHPTSHNFEI